MKFWKDFAVALSVVSCCVAVEFDGLVDIFSNSRCTFHYVYYTQWNSQSWITELISPFNASSSRDEFVSEDVNRARSHFLNGPLTFELLSKEFQAERELGMSESHRKFSHCVVHLVEGRFARCHLSFRRKEDRPYADYVWILHNNNNNNGPTSPLQFTERIDLLPLLEVKNVIPTIIFWVAGFREVSLVCIPCSLIGGWLEDVPLGRSGEQLLTLEAIGRQHSRLQGDLKGEDLTVEQVDIVPLNKCDLLGHSYNVLCSLELITGKLNASLGMSLIPDVFYEVIIQDTTIQSMNLVEFVPHVIQPYEYEFVVIKRDPKSKKLETQLEGILKPMSISTWALIIASSVTISAIVAIHPVITKDVNWERGNFAKSSVQTWISLAKLAFDQAGISKFIKGDTIFKILLWGQWSLIVLVASQMYRGDLFSYLMVSPTPQVPDTLESLAESDIMVGTSQSCTDKASLIISVYPCLWDGLGSNEAPFYAMLRNRLLYFVTQNIRHNFLQAGHTDDGANFFKGIVAESRAQVRSANLSVTFVKSLPETFAIIDNSEMIDEYSNLFPKYGRFWVSKKRATPFSTPSYWAMSDNFLYPIVSNILAGIGQSGMYELWDRNRAAFFSQTKELELHASLIELEKADLDRVEDDRMLIRQSMFCQEGCSKWLDGIREGFSPIPKALYLFIGYCWLGFIAAGTFLFMLEKLANFKAGRCLELIVKCLASKIAGGRQKETVCKQVEEQTVQIQVKPIGDGNGESGSGKLKRKKVNCSKKNWHRLTGWTRNLAALALKNTCLFFSHIAWHTKSLARKMVALTRKICASKRALLSKIKNL